MLVKVLGSGCSSCKTLEQRAQQAAEELKLPAEIKEIQDIEEMATYGIMRTPGLVINGKVISAGDVPDVEELKNFLLQAAVKSPV